MLLKSRFGSIKTAYAIKANKNAASGSTGLKFRQSTCLMLLVHRRGWMVSWWCQRLYWASWKKNWLVAALLLVNPPYWIGSLIPKTVRQYLLKQTGYPRVSRFALLPCGETPAIVVRHLGAGTWCTDDWCRLKVNTVDRFMLQLQLPTVCVWWNGFCWFGQNGREIGHGKLAKRGIQAGYATAWRFP